MSRHSVVSELFLRLCDLPDGARREILDRECAGDPDLRREVEALLARDAPTAAGTSMVLDVAAAAAALARDAGPPPGGFPATIGPYRIEREIGAGGAGQVYEAWDERLRRKVALKVLSMRRTSSHAGRRFDREAWILGRLNHPHIVNVFDRGEHEGFPYYAMELIGGGSLSEVLQHLRRDGVDDRFHLRFGTAEYTRWVIGQVIAAARALDYAHRHGVVHRDVKPLNLLLDAETAAVRVADFGIAMEDEGTRMTAEGTPIGTMRYMAPEQIRGDTRAIDRRTDVYGLGITLYEMLTLAHPYRGDTYDRYVHAVMTDEATSARRVNQGIGRDLATVVHKAIEKDARDRYATAADFADDLERVLQFRPVRARPAGPLLRLAKWSRRRPVHAALAAVLVAASAIVAVLGSRALEQRGALRQVEIRRLVDAINTEEAGGKDDAAIVALAEAMLRLDPRHVVGLRSRAVSRYNLALKSDAVEAERLRALGLADLETLAAVRPDSTWPHRLRESLSRTAGVASIGAGAPEAGAGPAGGGARPATSDPEAEDDLYYEGILALENGDWRGAEVLFSRVLAIRQRQDAILKRALCRRRLGDSGGAIDDYRYLAAANPRDTLALGELGRLYTETKRFDEARLHLERARTIAPADPLFPERLAFNAEAAGSRALGRSDRAGAAGLFLEAEREASACLALEPDRAVCHNLLGTARIGRYRAGDRSDAALAASAIVSYEQARRIAPAASPTADEALTNLCDVLTEIGSLDEALPRCREAVERAPDKAVRHYNLAGVLARLGRKEQALAALERDLALGDEDHAYLLQDPWFEDLRSDPRFRSIVARMKQAN